MGSLSGGFGILPPLDGGYRLESCHPRDSDPRHSALQSIESTLSTIDYPHTPSKLFTEPARVQDGAQFNVQSLDFLSDTPPSEPPSLIEDSINASLGSPLNDSCEELISRLS